MDQVLICQGSNISRPYILGLHRVLNMPEYFLNMPEYEGIWTNMAKSTCKAFVLHVPVVIPCELESVVTYFNEDYNLRGIKLFP